MTGGRFKLISLKSGNGNFQLMYGRLQRWFNLSVHMPRTGYLYWGGAVFPPSGSFKSPHHGQGFSVCQYSSYGKAAVSQNDMIVLCALTVLPLASGVLLLLLYIINIYFIVLFIVMHIF